MFQSNRLLSVLLWSVFLISGISYAQDASFPFTIRELMEGEHFIGHSPEQISWSRDGKYILFHWMAPEDSVYRDYQCDPKSGKITFVSREMSGSNTPYFDGNLAIRDGSIFRYEPKNNTLLSFLELPEDIEYVSPEHEGTFFFRAGINFFQYDNGTIRRLTNYSTHVIAPKQVSDTGFLSTQNSLFRKRKKPAHITALQTQVTPAKHFLETQPDILTMAPNRHYVLFRTSEKSAQKPTFIMNYLSEDGYASAVEARPKVGESEPNHHLFLHDLLTDSLIEVSFSQLTDIRKIPAYYRDYGISETRFDHDRKIVMHAPRFSPGSTQALIDVRSYDNKDRWLVILELKTGKLREVVHQHDEAWIGGPGISGWNMASGNLGWLNDHTIWFQSEESGYSHLYSLDLANGTKRALTQGSFEVHAVELSKDSSSFYLQTNRSHPGKRDFEKLDIRSGKLTAILSGKGAHEVYVSPDEKSLAVLYSTANQPWDLYCAPNSGKSSLVRLTDSRRKAFRAHSWIVPEVLTYRASDGVSVYARLYRPDSLKDQKAAVIFVHGAGYLQNAHHYWSTYYHEYLFHNYLTAQGFTVLDVDYRASEGYGRDYRTAIYRHMGGRDLLDIIDGKHLLEDSLGIAPDRIGIYGGSYGGFITIMAMLTTPDEFVCGAALRSVTDWAHYNHEYTSNILNYPDTDPLAYRRSSPVYFADSLRGKLLMLHGMMDNNVHYQDVVRLSQLFIEHDKHTWQLIGYPVESHGFVNPDSWTDEYTRIYELMVLSLLRPYGN